MKARDKRGEVALLMAAGILIFAVIFSFWRVHKDTPRFMDDAGAEIVEAK